MKILAKIWLLASVMTVLGGCQKGELRENNVSDESKVAVKLSAGSPVSVASKAAVDKWNSSDVNVFGLKRKRGIDVGDNAYDFTDSDNFVDYPATAAAGTSASLEVYADKEKEIPYFYTEGHVYDFYGYHLGGATATDKNISGDAYSYSVTFLGNNDLMYADTDRAEDILTSNDPSVTESDVYSAWAARRNVHPTLVFRHALTRLNFIVKGKGDKWQNVMITGVDVKSVNTGTLTVTGTDIGFVPSEDTPVTLSLKTAADEDFMSEDVALNPDDIALGGEGACLMVAPGMSEIEVTVHMKHKTYENVPLADYSFIVKASDISHKDEYGNPVPVSHFEAGHAYDVYINVYGPEEIIINAQIAKWEDGGDYTYDPDEDICPGNGSDSEPNALHKVTGVQVYDDGQYYGVIKFSYDEQDRLTSVEAVYDENGTESVGYKYVYTSEGLEIQQFYDGNPDETLLVRFDDEGNIVSGGDWDFEYSTSGDYSEITAYSYGELQQKWVMDGTNCISMHSVWYGDYQYEYYSYANAYSVDMNCLMLLFGYGEKLGYWPLEVYRTKTFTSAELLKSDGNSSYSYQFDSEDKVSSILMTSATSTYTLEPHYDSFDEIFDAFPGTPSEEDSEVSGAVLPLDNSGNANCYVVSQSGSYSFSSVKGNSEESVGAVNSAAVLWESFGTDVAPNVGDLVTNVSFENGRVQFDVPSDYKEGNAVIAAMDEDGTVLWSWHIWLTDKPAEQVYYKNAGTMMDRNLGATSATPGDVGALGLLYQWGRKDPFLGSSSIIFSEFTVAESTITWPAMGGDLNVEYTVSHPTSLLGSHSRWWDSPHDQTLWQSSANAKTIYDPCPAGWRVPDAGLWNTACGTTLLELTKDDVNNGYEFSGVFGGDDIIWYPHAGERACQSEGEVRGGFHYWSTASSLYTTLMQESYNGIRTIFSGENLKVGCYSVRCCRDVYNL